MNSIEKLIESVTGVHPGLGPVIERIMREDIFHGPLDWQSFDELTMAAKEALAIYEADKEFHDADTHFRKARWNRVLAEREATEHPESEAHQGAFATALEFENSAMELLNRFSNAMA